MAFLHRLAQSSRAPLLCSVALLTQYQPSSSREKARCETLPSVSSPKIQTNLPPSTKPITEPTFPSSTEGMQEDAVGDYDGLFPARQLWVPIRPYPWWNKNWDGLHPTGTGDPEADRLTMRQLRKTGTTRHIILVRHGQYDETHKEDEKRILTELGKKQAELTGKRIAEMMKGAENGFGPCQVKSLRVSGMSRARETAQIIAQHLDGIDVQESEPEFNEGRPCHTIPGNTASEKTIQTTDENHKRIEAAFRKVFHRAPSPDPEQLDDEEAEKEKHEFEVIVCHANVIRYWMCRALQLPPEAWLRYCPFNCSLTYITIRPTGSVSCRMIGDIGHLPYELQTFSGHHGFNCLTRQKWKQSLRRTYQLRDSTRRGMNPANPHVGVGQQTKHTRSIFSAFAHFVKPAMNCELDEAISTCGAVA